MKLRNREVNIFSMSALDLFASGMGAFILLAFMALPFFPKTGTHEDLSEELREARREIQETRAERERARRRADELARQVAELEVPDVDVVICLDVTGSMSAEITGLKNQIVSLVEVLNRVAPTGVGVVAFGDDMWRQPLHVLDITTDVAGIRRFVNGLVANMNDPDTEQNRDGPEAVSLALEAAERLSWRASAEVRHVVVITDNPAKNRPAALAAATRIAGSPIESHVAGVLVRSESEAGSFLRDLAARGDGEFVDGNRRTMLGAVLLAVLG